jgi:hypothetical protein
MPNRYGPHTTDLGYIQPRQDVPKRLNGRNVELYVPSYVMQITNAAPQIFYKLVKTAPALGHVFNKHKRRQQAVSFGQMTRNGHSSVFLSTQQHVMLDEFAVYAREAHWHRREFATQSICLTSHIRGARMRYDHAAPFALVLYQMFHDERHRFVRTYKAAILVYGTKTISIAIQDQTKIGTVHRYRLLARVDPWLGRRGMQATEVGVRIVVDFVHAATERP